MDAAFFAPFDLNNALLNLRGARSSLSAGAKRVLSEHSESFSSAVGQFSNRASDVVTPGASRGDGAPSHRLKTTNGDLSFHRRTVSR